MSEEWTDMDAAAEESDSVTEPEERPVEEPAGEPEPEPQDGASEPEETAEEEDDFQLPDWFSEPAQQQQSYQPPPYQGMPPQPPQYPPQYQQPQQPQISQQDMDALIQNPREFAARVAQEQMERGFSPILQQLNQMQSMMAQERAQRARAEIQRTTSVLAATAKEVLGKDDSYRGNSQVRGAVDTAMREFARDAQMRAMNGDPSRLDMMTRPEFLRAALAVARVLHGSGQTSRKPVAAKGTQVESTKPRSKPSPAREIDANTKAALDRLGISSDRYFKSLSEASDWEFEG